MRLGLATKDPAQATVMLDLLKPVFGEVKVYDVAAMDSGEFQQSSDHVMILDYSDDSILEMECVGVMLDRDEPKIILSEKQLYALPHDERLAWRKKVIAEILKLLPHFASEINTSKEVNRGNDIWVIGSSSGGPDALTNFLTALPVLPVSLVITQHIASGDGTTAVLRLLNTRQSRWVVQLASDGAQIRPGHAYIVQRDTVVSVEGDRLMVRDFQLPGQPSPSINATLRSIRKSSSGEMGVVILTGMGDDGSAALKEIKHKTMMVLAQDASECAARSMPDAARQAGVVDATDGAVGLARRIADHYGVREE